MLTKKFSWFFCCVLAWILLLTASIVFASESGWEKKVPESDRSRSNPVGSDPDAIANGGKIYGEKCAKCHGETAEGKGHHPSLRTQAVQQATPGELEWLIAHGNRWHGMPAFGSLPEAERWQLVSYIKSLGVTK